jgi:tetratricopeptide (TPR) repeat protein
MEEAQYDLETRLNKEQWNATLRSMPHLPRVSETLLAEAIALHQDGDYEAAKALLNADEHIDNDPVALNARGLAALGHEKFDGALADFTKTIELLKTQLSEVMVNQSSTFIQMRRYDAALQAAHEARQLNSQWVGPWEDLLSIYCRQRQLDAAFAIAEEMKAQWPGWSCDEELARYLVEDIDLSPLRSDPRFRQTFAALLRRKL